MKKFLVLFIAVLLFQSVMVKAQDDDEDFDFPTPESKDQSHVGSQTDAETSEREENAISYEGFSPKEREMLEEMKETFGFQAEISRLMDIIINSLYTNKEIFLRELISNASDAIDKMKYLSLSEGRKLGEGDEAVLDIHIKADRDAKTISVRDKGVGMTKEELINHLGTVASSGTTKFLDAAASGDSNTLSLIGQFGVGFYSVYLVADQVTVISKSDNSDTQWVWHSEEASGFSISEDPRGNTLGRGTEVILHIKDEAREYLEATRLENLVKKYSEFINWPIYLYKSHRETKEVEIEDEPKEEDEVTEELEKEVSDDDIEVKDEEPKKKTKTESFDVWDWEHVNKQRPIWTRPMSDITEEEYNAFYKSVTKDEEDPLTHIHFSTEGGVQFRSILYAPGKAPQDFYDKYFGKSSSLKLYVRRVLIAEEFEDFMPPYLSFIRGVVDSEDLPLNVNRETLQRHHILQVIAKKLVRKSLQMLKDFAAECEENEEEEESVTEPKEEKECKYDIFWKSYGKSIRMGLTEDRKNKHTLAKLLRYESNISDGKLVSLQTYVDRMQNRQDSIYYITGETIETVKNSPFLERFKARDLEVLYMVDPLDEYAMQNLPEFNGKKLVSIARTGLELPGESKGQKEKYEQKVEELKPLSDYLKELYGNRVESVAVSKRITHTAAVLVTAQYGWSANMERIMRAQPFGDKGSTEFMKARKTMEINPYHPLIIEMAARIAKEGYEEDKQLKDTSELLFDICLLNSGFVVDHTPEFATRINRVLQSGLGLDPDAQPSVEAEEFEEEPEEEEEQEEEENVEEIEDMEDDVHAEL